MRAETLSQMATEQVSPALWATGGVAMSLFPLSRQRIQPLAPLLGGRVHPFPTPPLDLDGGCRGELERPRWPKMAPGGPP
eukprot:1025638-Pyramimonas_sp.AAC.1